MSPPSHYIAPHCDEPLPVLHANDDLIVVNKPAFLYTVPGRGPENNDSVIPRLLPDYPEAVIMHSLDLNTTGLVIVARSERARGVLSQQIRDRQMQKTYQAVVCGIVAADQDETNLPIAKDRTARPRCKIDYNEGKASRTCFQVVERDPENNRTLLPLTPETGRPIPGCDLYAHEQALRASPHPMLHACGLALQHPDGSMISRDVKNDWGFGLRPTKAHDVQPHR